MKRLKSFSVPLVLAALAAIPFVLVVVLFPGEQARALEVYIVFLGAMLLFGLVRTTAGEKGAWRTSILDREEGERPEWGHVAELSRLERDVVLATGSELEQHVRVKPLLRDIVEHRLWSRRGIELEESSERAREALGPEVWELVKPGRPDPNARNLRGLDLAAVTTALDRIEAL